MTHFAPILLDTLPPLPVVMAGMHQLDIARIGMWGIGLSGVAIVMVLALLVLYPYVYDWMRLAYRQVSNATYNAAWTVRDLAEIVGGCVLAAWLWMIGWDGTDER